jgi:YfiH family protein
MLGVPNFVPLDFDLPGADSRFGTRAHTHPDANQTVVHYTNLLGPVAHLRQVHGKRIVYAKSGGLYEEADAVYTDRPNLWLAVKTADCVPVLLSAPGIVCAVHAGWRGLKEGIIAEAVRTICGTANIMPDEIHAAVGPCISAPFYEVEVEIADGIPHAVHGPSKNYGKALLNLGQTAREQLLAAGVPGRQAHQVKRCTFKEKSWFNSYRRTKGGDPAAYAVQLSLIKLA